MATWPTLPVRIGLYMVGSLKETDSEVEDFKKFKFGTRSFNPYNAHGLCRDHCARVYYPWIHGACHWPEEDSWRYCYNSSRTNEPINIVVEWLESLKVAALQVVATSIKPVQDKGKRKIVKGTETKKSYKFKEDPLVQKVSLKIDVKR